jgi:hypothetical protein
MTSKIRTIALVFMLVVLLLPATPKAKAVGSPESEALACIEAAGTFFDICIISASSSFFYLFGPGMIASCGRKYNDDLDACSAAYPY